MDELKHLRELEDAVTAKEEIVESCKKDLSDAKKEFDAAVAALRLAVRETEEPAQLPIPFDGVVVHEGNIELVDEAHQLPEAPQPLNANRGLPWDNPPATPTVPPNPTGSGAPDDEEGPDHSEEPPVPANQEQGNEDEEG